MTTRKPRRRRDAFADYYPHDPALDAYLEWLKAPGEDLGLFLGDAPSIEARLARYRQKRRGEPHMANDDRDETKQENR